MYRALGWTLICKGVSPDDATASSETAASLKFDFRLEDGGQRVLIDGEDVTGRIRTPEVADAASRVAVHTAVREILVARQKEMGADGGIVLEGRDTGTAVFPGADLKVFLVADVAERALRQQRALLDRGERTPLDVLTAQIHARDARDRATQRRSGSWPASDAIEVDTTGLSIDAQVARVVELARERGL